MRASVIGGSTVTDEEYELAREVGRLLGERDHTVVCGGLGGVMEAACRGSTEADGHTIGILPGERRDAANDYVDTAIATGLGHARNPLVVVNGDAAIAIDGGGGTLSELGFTHVFDRPVAGLGTHQVERVSLEATRTGGGETADQTLDWIEHVATPEAAVEYVEREASEDPR